MIDLRIDADGDEIIGGGESQAAGLDEEREVLAMRIAVAGSRRSGER
jgi:hypothetical protein